MQRQRQRGAGASGVRGEATGGGLAVVGLVAAKFHSAALTAEGRLFTWGWGRGGRLGHPDYNIHSGERALIHPWQVAGLGRRCVVSCAAAKHHMLAATSAGELWSWGGNRDGKLGYAGVDTQPTPRRIDFRGRAVLVAASDRHSACLTSAGEAWTWGSNQEGQLGYGTNNSANNPTPRLVEAMKGKALVALSVSKRHSVVLSAEGEAFVWGHRVVTPRRVPLAGSRDTARLAAPAPQQPQPQSQQTPSGAASASGTTGATAASGTAGAAGAAVDVVRFHRNHAEVVRPEAALVAAGLAHTSVVTRTGAVLVWRSADPALRAAEVGGALAGKVAVAVAAAKTRTVVVTEGGLVFMWEARLDKEGGGGGGGGGAGAGPAAAGAAASVAGGGGGGASGSGSSSATDAAAAAAAAPIVPLRVAGLSRVAAVAVGEKHTLALQGWLRPPMPDQHGTMPGPRRRRRHRRSSGGSSGSESGSDGDEGVGVPALGARLGLGRAGAGGLGGDGSSLPRGGSGAWGGALGSTPPPLPGSSPSGRGAWGGGGGGSSTAAAASPATPGSACFGTGSLPRGGSLAGLWWGGAAGARGGGAEAGGHGWALFSHRLAADGGSAAAATPRGRRSSGGGGDDDDDGGDDVFGLADFADGGGGGGGRAGAGGGGGGGAVPPLQVLCQAAVAASLVEPRTALPLLEYADAAGAALLRCHCAAAAVANLDAALTEAPGGLAALPPHLLAELEHLYRSLLLAAPPPTAAGGGGGADAAAAAPLGGGGLPDHPDGAGGQLYGTSPAYGTSYSRQQQEQHARSLPYGSAGGGSPGGAQLSALEAFHRRRTLLSRLQRGRRPTAAPAWLAGAAAADRMAPAASSAAAAAIAAAQAAALGAIGHGSLPGIEGEFPELLPIRESLIKYVFEPAAAQKDELVKKIKEMRGR
ncbi:E3 ubiquitin-protein ligase [Tetrabaena socialis]|uniref:E3 ubiquitin-protein ligase n=1 Tax=Tetrabaena socialis TaxID=47790 RepID=A0A2J7ZK58_9CHLO|nr:E3 ubiquitin-protein ligase [Tetrabaena socialis]|eukprot:PNH00658.1 E3 ubiquitin-protein ligase [Tetrabaena socialis]